MGRYLRCRNRPRYHESQVSTSIADSLALEIVPYGYEMRTALASPKMTLRARSPEKENPVVWLKELLCLPEMFRGAVISALRAVRRPTHSNHGAGSPFLPR